MEEYRLELIETNLRWVCLLWKHDILARLSFHHNSAAVATTTVENEFGKSFTPETRKTSLADSLARYAAGENVSFSDIRICTPQTDFQQKVIACCRKIPYGSVMTYGEVAQQVGHPRAARAVGGVMRNNSCPLVVPCHRVLGRGGKLTGFSAGSGIDLKLRLLQMEGINRKFVF